MIRYASATVAGLATLLVGATAGAGPPRFELEPKLGYAGTFTTGLSPYGAFVGLGVRARPIAHLWLGASLFSFIGTRAAAEGPDVSYRARDRAYDAAFDATWRFEVGPLLIEPGAEAGAAWVIGSTYVTPTRITDRYVAANVGPVFRLATRVGPLALGTEAAALFVPSYGAAPVLRVGAVVLLSF